MIKKINYLLSKKDKKWLVILLFLSLLSSIIETVGIGAIMPFISMASNPDLISNNHYLSLVYNYFIFEDKSLFIVYFGFTLILFYIFRAIYTIIYGYLLNKFTMDKYSSIANNMFDKS